ncbi:MAG: hypothetical protein LBU66_05120 [Treponema sp.]|jgi:hypothetical protein|nr:hypothetical protein [Treponema sp.]
MRKIILLIALCFLVFSCDLFNATEDPDFWQKLDEEIAWANAKKLTVALSAPGAWGQGSITTTAENRRLGYGFNVEFHPAQGYSILEWRAYSTDDIEAYRNANPDWNWLQAANPAEAFMDAKLDQLEWGKNIERLSPSLPGGGTFVFKINVNKRVTLIPWCGNQPMIKNIDVGDEKIYPDGNINTEIKPTKAITIELSSPVDPNTVILREGHIEIHTWELDVNGKPTGEGENAAELFTARWNSGSWRITIEPKDDSALQLENRKITVTLGKEIKNVLEESLDIPRDNLSGLVEEDEKDDEDKLLYRKISFSLSGLDVYEKSDAKGDVVDRKISFSRKTFALSEIYDIEVKSWTAKYDESKSEIEINWGLSKPGIAEIEYEINRSGRRKLQVTGTSAVITNAQQSLDANGVRSGQGVRNIQRYDIWIRLVDGDGGFWDREHITIWNIPGMSFTHDNTATVSSKDELKAALIDTTKTNIALTGSFDVSNWQPRDFTNRNFYGNGYTVTINGFRNNGAGFTDIGLFGEVENAVIRDLTVAYSDITINATVGRDIRVKRFVPRPSPATAVFEETDVNASLIGGIVGSAIDTEILNCTVRGATSTATLKVSAASGTQDILIGGIAGYFRGSGIIENCRADLSVAYESSGHTGEVNIGGIAGETGEGTDTGVNAVRKLSFNNGYTLGTPRQGPNVTLDRLLLNKVTVTANVTADKGNNAGELNIGGAVGRSEHSTMNDVEYTAGKVSFLKDDGTGRINCGGIIGYSQLTSLIDCHFFGYIETIDGEPVNGGLNVGGLVGVCRGNVSLPDQISFINNCTVQGSLETVGTSLMLGGVFGDVSSNGTLTLTNTFFIKGEIRLEDPNSAEIGGFTSRLSVMGIYNCGVKEGTLYISRKSSTGSPQFIGGFIAYNGSDIYHCFSNMNIIYNANTVGVIHIGGFSGINTSGGIKNCYATGFVQVTITNTTITSGSVNIGGLVGISYALIENSYALGNVLVNKSGGALDVHAGGLVGELTRHQNWNSVGSVNNCFSAGQVVAQSQTTAVYAGGLVGYRHEDAHGITNSAALGASVTAKAAAGSRGVGRIYGFPANNIGTNNHALNTMVIETDVYTATTPLTRVAAPGLAAPDGANAEISSFMQSSIWINTLGFNISNNRPVDNWNFARVGSEGHPRLAWE